MSLIGKSIGHIRIEEFIGHGGMGDVYLGFDETLQRKVAVKSIAARGLPSPHAKSRFLREARALSHLDHPHICKIYDLVESEGAAFLILEFIEGRTLAQALREGLPKPEKLRIALEIARVLEVAHAKGIVHRDLKPSNIKLTPEGEVKVLDFGLARFLGHPAAGHAPEDVLKEPGLGDESPATPLPTELAPGQTLSLETPGRSTSLISDLLSDSMPTEQGAIMGTPGYMSPEQARGDRATPASDMYSFGLILQELFTGRPARDGGDRERLYEAARKGLTVPVTGLPADLTTLINRLKSPSPAARPTAVETVERLVRIQGKPRRRLRRALASGIALAFLLAGIKYTVDLGHQKRQALQARDEADNVVKFLVNLFSVSDPGEARGNTITAREVLDKGAREISQGLEKQPLTRARMMDAIGTVFRKLGLYTQAEPLIAGALEIREKELKPNHLQVAESLISLAALRQAQGRFQESRELYQRALNIRTRALPPDDLLIAEAKLGLGEILFELRELPEAEALFKSSLEIREKRLGPDHQGVAESLLDLGWLYYSDSQFDKAEVYFKQSLPILEKSLGPDHPQVAESLNKLGGLCLWLRRYQEADDYYHRALAIRQKVYGPDHPRVADSYDNLGLLYEYQGSWAEAREYAQKALAIRQKVLGENHPDLARCYFSLGTLDHRQGAFLAAERSYRTAIAILEQAYGQETVEIAPLLGNLAEICLDDGRTAEAEKLLQRAIANTEKEFGAGDYGLAHPLYQMGVFLLNTGRLSESQSYFDGSLAIIEKEEGPTHYMAIEPLWGLARLARLKGEREAALGYLARAEVIAEKEKERNRVVRGMVLAERAWYLFHDEKDYAAADEKFRKALELIGSELSPRSPEYRETATEYMALLRETGQVEKARALAAKLGTRTKSIP